MAMRQFLIGLIFFTIFCGMGGKAGIPRESDENIKTIVNGNNRFCFNLYKQLTEKESGNIFYSPFSITMAMAMVFEGAKGWVQSEIQGVFNFPLDEKIRRESFLALYKQLNKKSAKYKLHIANALWIQKDYPFLPSYLKTIQKYYDGYARNVDFVAAPEPTRQIINKWVEEKTNQKIKDLFPPGTIDQQSRLVITNAIYFKGQWLKQFDRTLTAEEDFWVTPTRSIKVPMMKRIDPEARFNYAETDELQILELPYEGKELSMLILLPRKNDLSFLEKELTDEKLEEWKKLLSETRVEVYLPKFTFRTRYVLTPYLSQLGMPNAFAPHCDFSGIDGTKNLYIRSVVHQAYVDVNEEGTEAAAATGVVVGITSVGPKIPVFRADHPFIFLIQDKNTGNILFIGRVVEPAQ
ncbi:MAG: serpin family protein [candidate division WOR-3 bacterium]|nr:serpin family protein [candidate division WOR-3 bacterium]